MIEIPSFINGEMLKDIRNHTDWRNLFDALGLERSPQSKEHDWWACSPFSEDKTPSFHINDRGWYCHSTHQGGGVIELVQKVVEHRSGQILNCYDAGRWLLEQGLSSVSDQTQNSVPTAHTARSEKEKEVLPADTADASTTENLPIRQNLLPSLSPDHAEFTRRGISPETCQQLGCGYLSEDSKSNLSGRIVFQVRGVREDDYGKLQPVILTHIGRALTPEQTEEDGKWRHYAGFTKTLELYNIDQAILDPKAVEQARQTGHILVVEGCFDIAKLAEAGVHNAVATFGAHLADTQIPRLEQLTEQTGVNKFLFWYDRDNAGTDGVERALETLDDTPILQTQTFDWQMTFPSEKRGDVQIPEEIGDVCEFSVEQLQWLRAQQII